MDDAPLLPEARRRSPACRAAPASPAPPSLPAAAPASDDAPLELVERARLEPSSPTPLPDAEAAAPPASPPAPPLVAAPAVSASDSAASAAAKALAVAMRSSSSRPPLLTAPPVARHDLVLVPICAFLLSASWLLLERASLAAFSLQAVATLSLFVAAVALLSLLYSRALAFVTPAPWPAWLRYLVAPAFSVLILLGFPVFGGGPAGASSEVRLALTAAGFCAPVTLSALLCAHTLGPMLSTVHI